MRLSIALLLLAASPAWGQARDFKIAGEAFAEADIVDARAQPQLGGGAAILLSFEGHAINRVASITSKLAGKPVPVTLDGETISSPTLAAPVSEGAFQIANAAWTTESAAILARRISGKDPLPDSLED